MLCPKCDSELEPLHSSKQRTLWWCHECDEQIKLDAYADVDEYVQPDQEYDIEDDFMPAEWGKVHSTLCPFCRGKDSELCENCHGMGIL